MKNTNPYKHSNKTNLSKEHTFPDHWQHQMNLLVNIKNKAFTITNLQIIKNHLPTANDILLYIKLNTLYLKLNTLIFEIKYSYI